MTVLQDSVLPIVGQALARRSPSRLTSVEARGKLYSARQVRWDEGRMLLDFQGHVPAPGPVSACLTLDLGRVRVEGTLSSLAGSVMRLQVESAQVAEKRRYPRCHLEGHTSLPITLLVAGERLLTTAVDISCGGVRLTAPSLPTIEAGSHALLDFSLPGSCETTASAEVLGVQDDEVRLEFMSMPAPMRTALSAFVLDLILKGHRQPPQS